MVAPGSVLASGGSYLSDQALYKLYVNGSVSAPSLLTVNLPLNKLWRRHKRIFLNISEFTKKG